MPLEVFELTEKGREFIKSTRSWANPRVRAVLLKVDGIRTFERLTAYAKQYGLDAADLRKMEAQGFITERKLIPDHAGPHGHEFENSIMYDSPVEEMEAHDFYHTLTDNSIIQHSIQGAGADLVHPDSQPGPRPVNQNQKMAGLSIVEKLTPMAEDFFKRLPPELKPHELIKRHPRIFNRIDLMQHQKQDLLAYLDKLLLMTEDTKREGFSFQVIIELNNLKECIEKKGKFF